MKGIPKIAFILKFSLIKNNKQTILYGKIFIFRTSQTYHCVKSVQIRSYFWSVFSRILTEYGPEITPYLDTFHAAYFSGK